MCIVTIVCTEMKYPVMTLYTVYLLRFCLGSLVRSCDNHGVLGGGGNGDDSHDSHDADSSLEESTGDEDEDHRASNLVLQLKSQTTPGTTYKLRDSRIIEIAGGREVYCQSRSKSSRSKSGGNHGGGGGKSGNVASVSRTKSRDIWELRSKLHAQCVVEPKKQTSVSDGNSSAEVTETVFSNEVSSVKHQRQQNNLSLGPDDGCVVFDDIGPADTNSWGRRSSRHNRGNGAPLPRSGGPLSSGGSSPSPPLHHYPFHFSSNHPLFFKQQQESSSPSLKPAHLSNEPPLPPLGGSEDRKQSGGGNDGSPNGKVLGSPLPIAQYEGSPRRYGHVGNQNKLLSMEPSPPHQLPKLTEPPVLPSLLSSPSVYLPKPGFPQRILDEDSPLSGVVGVGGAIVTSANVSTSTNTQSSSPPPLQSPGFDYLYEFSETRKVLEEFFKPEDSAGANGQQFRDLDYELRRQQQAQAQGSSPELKPVGGTGGRGSSYVGLRLASDAQEVGSDRSPHRKASQDYNDPAHGYNEGGSHKERDLLAGFSVSTEMLSHSAAGSASGMYHQHNRQHSRDTPCRSGGSSGRLYSSGVAGVGVGLPPSRRCSSPHSESELHSIGKSRNFTLSPETTDCESNCGDLDSEISSLVLVMDEVLLMKRQISEIEQEIVVQRSHHGKLDEETTTGGAGTLSEQALSGCPSTCTTTTTPSPLNTGGGGGSNKKDILDPGDIDLTSLDPLNGSVSLTGDPISESGGGGDSQGDEGAGEPPPPAPTPHRGGAVDQQCVEAALKDIRLTLQRTKTLPLRRPPSLSSPPLASGSTGGSIGEGSSSPGGEEEGESAAPVWVPRKPGGSGPRAQTKMMRTLI
ncbi:hypothetical protein WDU94_015406 [Cyamophila willieti]